MASVRIPLRGSREATPAWVSLRPTWGHLAPALTWGLARQARRQESGIPGQTVAQSQEEAVDSKPGPAAPGKGQRPLDP